ncbi:peripherin-2-like isoform X1 [Vanessa cardui]|uniref:peripherin-2-like isoform X1 n=1 Tax=Vanessa cardui TaxID=171605 RepID=UPI001F147C14|nr:peripherin-2-like isoform X1 [Vanessa cardui]
MARGETLTKDGRRLAGVLRALLIAQLTISLVMVIYSYNTSYKIMSLLKKIHKFKVLLIYTLILLQAYCMKLHYTSGFRLVSWMLRCPQWSRVGPVARLWLLSGTLLAANGLLVHAACKTTLKALMKELSSTLRIGMTQYLAEPTWKQFIDTMQIELNCCGADRPEDWHEVPWINIDFLNEDEELVIKLSGTDGKMKLPISPYSCCSPHVLTACYHDPLQQEHMEDGGVRSLQGRGCRVAAQSPLARVAFAVHLLTVLCAILQLLIMLLTHLLHGATKCAKLEESSATVRKRGLRTRSFPYLS